MHPTLLFLTLVVAVAAEPTGWTWACRPGLSVCSRCVITWTGANNPLVAKVINDAQSASSCVVSVAGDSCTWAVDLAPGSTASVVVTSNGTDYSHTLGQVECQADCPLFADPASKSSTTTTKLDPGDKTESPNKPSKQAKTTTQVSTAPPTEVTTTDEQGHITTIVIPGAVSTNIITVDDETPKGLSTGTVAAIASVSSIAGLALIIGVWYSCRRSRRHSEEMELEDSILFGPPVHGSTAHGLFSPSSNATAYDSQEILGPTAGQRTSAYAGPGIASTFPARYTDPYSEPSSPVMRPNSRTSAPNSPVMVPRNRSGASLDRLSRPSSLVLISEPAVSARPMTRYDDDDVAEFVATDIPVTMRSLVPGKTRPGAGIKDRPHSWVDPDDWRASMTHDQVAVLQRKARGSPDLDARQPLLQH
ncbi:hypothetical protein CspeluHIS016_0108120 [Cutaneotrichosporon spelunceum]|uniref:Mid2 domain-containing protein n=1 Tax=Cutaneotrichosporon spelunceum TaxID=1672016 RepID=A0AAD3TPN5_9TREE|nr:hypothetical protein CspeluHIS016_0108120 [Cutaneotrichosporon spelunceum]